MKEEQQENKLSKKELRKEQKEQKSRERKEGLTQIGTDIFSGIREIITGTKERNKESIFSEYLYHAKGKVRPELEKYICYENQITTKHSAYSPKEWFSFACFGLLCLYILTQTIGIVYSYLHLKPKVFTNNIFILLMTALIPFVCWMLATNENYWAFHKRKRVYFSLCVANLFLVMLQPVYSGTRNVLLPYILKIPTNEVMTNKKVLLLAYISILLIIGIICIVVYVEIEPLLMSKQLRRQIELFKLGHAVDNRKDKKYKYDVKTIKSLESGSPITIKENDRFLQGVINGPSGTGKTSTIFENVICQDLDQKIINKERRQEEMLSLIVQKKATIQGPLREFNENAVIPVGRNKHAIEKNRKELEKIKKKYPDCGITVIAPNASMIEDIIRLAAARGYKVNVIDPINDYSGYSNVISAKMNPFYVPLGLTEEERVIYITNASMVFSDVLIATNQSDGDSDQYFTDISLAVSSNISAVVMLAKNIMGEQAYIDDVQECISDFKNLESYVKIIEDHYNISIKSSQVKNKRGIDGDDLGISGDGTIRSNGKKNPYYYQLLFVRSELLGMGNEDMFSQARGLRNLITKVLQDPRIKNKLSAREDHERLDFDKLLSENQITLVNTAIELGKNVSTSFGLFFLLLHRVSTLRRPVPTRTPHFLWIDEATQYMHPMYEDVVSLYRQYRVAAMITLQSLNQTEKSRSTAYLRNVFLGAGNHIVFGRLTPEEMKLYSEMGGISRETEEQVSSTQNSVWSSNPNYTESVRTTPTMLNNLEGSDIRILDFLELTIFTVDNGRVLPGQLGKVFFIGNEAFDRKRLRTIMWNEVVPEAFDFDRMKEEEEDDEIFLSSGEEYLDDIPEEETQTIIRQVNEAAPKIEAANMENVSLADLFQMIKEPDTAKNKTAAVTQKPVAEEKTVPASYGDDEIDYDKELKKLDGRK